MRIRLLLVIAAALALSLPLGAAHRHGRDCGHVYDSHRGAWISVQLATPFGVGYINGGLDDRYYRDSRSLKQRQKFLKKLRKQRLKEERRFRHRRHHVRGARW